MTPNQMPGVARADAVRALQEGGNPRRAAVAGEREQRVAEVVAEERASVAPDVAPHFAHRDRGVARPRRQLAHPASDRLAHGRHHQREQNAGEADREEDYLPGTDGAEDRHRPRPLLRDQADHHAAEQERETRPDVDADGVDRERGRELPRRKVVGDHRVGRRRERRLADADAEAQQQEVPVLASEAAARGHQAPGEETGGDDAAATPGIGETTERQPEEGVEQREAEAHEQAHLRVRDAEVAPDRPHQETQDLAIDEREDVDHHQHGDHVPGVAGGWVRLGVGRRLGADHGGRTSGGGRRRQSSRVGQ